MERYGTKSFPDEAERKRQRDTVFERNVKISILCPGPVKTNFTSVANVRFHIREANSYKVAKYAIDQTLKGKEIIVPGFLGKVTYILNKIIPVRISKYFIYLSQNGKRNY